MSIKRGCKLLGHARSAYYESRDNRQGLLLKSRSVEAFILERTAAIRREMPRIGGHKLYYLIKQDAAGCGYKFGEKKLFSVLREHGLLVKKRKKHVFTTDSSHWRNQFDNLIEETKAGRPEQIWVADITYFRTSAGCLYGHLVTDAYSKKLMGWAVSEDMAAASTLLALKMAIKNRAYDGPLIHHSDRGAQYLSELYTGHLKKHGILISVTQNGSPYDNPVAERINGILKGEFGFDGNVKNLEHARELLEKAVHIYNDKRPHFSNHMLTPNQMHKQRDLKPRTWEMATKAD